MIVAIVEGFSEVESVPVLLRRYQAVTGHYRMEIARPIRVKRNQVVKQGELEKAVQLAMREYPGSQAILVILDADDDAPCELGPSLLERVRRVAGPTRSAVVLPNREFESWFLASLPSLAGRRGLPSDIAAPRQSESIRDAKGYLTRAMIGKTYLEVDDQPAFTQEFDFELALRASRSFQKFDKEAREIFSGS